MSSNPYHNHPVITRSNYEEYLLLYVDDELTAEEKTAVDQFLLLHPDLQQELDILMQTKLPLELLSMDEKESLLSGSMEVKASEEDLLLYIDDELSEAETKRVEETIAQDATYRLQYGLLLKTKSDAAEKVVCSFKEDLYRREQRKVPVLWWRVAAVVLLAIGIGTFMMTNQQQPSEDVASLPSKPLSQPSVANPGTRQQQPDTPPQNELAMESGNSNSPSATGKTDKEHVPVMAMTKRAEKETVTKTANTRVQPDPEDIVVENMRHQSNDAPVLMPEKAEEPVRKALTKAPVTSEPLYTYNNTNAPVNAVPAVADDETEKSRTTLKGLLRKASRYVERRTNINVTNENEQLLIGSVAISLK